MSTERADVAGALDGVTILDLTQNMAGPGGTMLLADMGADVIRVDPPPEERISGLIDGETRRRRIDLVLGRNKRSIAVDLTTPDGREIVYDLARRADVIAQNYRPDVAEKLGMDRESLRRVNPQAIYSRVSAFGDRGPDRHRPGYDAVAQAGAGSMIAGRDGRPVPESAAIADVTGFCLEVIAILAALYHRGAGGPAQAVSTSMLAGAVMQNIARLVSVERADLEWRREARSRAAELVGTGAPYHEVLAATTTGIGGLPMAGGSGGMLGGQHPVLATYYGAYRTKDGYITVGCLSTGQQRRLNAALDLDDPRFDPHTPPDTLREPRNTERIMSLKARADAAFASRTTGEMLAHLASFDVACSSVQTVVDLFDSVHAREEQIIVDYDDPLAGPVKMFGFPIDFERTPMRLDRPAPSIGEHSDEILAWLGHDQSSIQRLRDSNVVF